MGSSERGTWGQVRGEHERGTWGQVRGGHGVK